MTNVTLCGEKTSTRWEVAATVWEEGSGGDRGSDIICHLPAVKGIHANEYLSISHIISHKSLRMLDFHSLSMSHA